LGFIMPPALKGAMSEGIEPSRQGELQGAAALLDAIAQVGGPFALSAIFSFFISSSSPAHQSIPGAPFFLGAAIQVLSTLCMIIAWSCCGHTRKPRTVIDFRDPVSSLEMPPRPSASILAHDKADQSQSKSRTSSKPSDSKVALDLHALRVPRAVLHFDPQADSSKNSRGTTPRGNSPRGVTPEPQTELRPPSRAPLSSAASSALPRVHLENEQDEDDNEVPTLKIHKDENDDNASVISDLNPIDYKHINVQQQQQQQPPPYNSNSYSSSHFGTLKGPRVHEDPEVAEEQENPISRRGYGTRESQLLAQQNDVNYAALRTSSLDVDNEEPKLKIHLSEDDENE